jgi:hypothetical protein
MRADRPSAQLRMPTFVPHQLLCCLLKELQPAGVRVRSLICSRTSQGTASPFFKPLFQIVLNPLFRDIVKCNGELLFSRSVSYVLCTPLIPHLWDKTNRNLERLISYLETGLDSAACRVERCVIDVCFLAFGLATATTA